MSRKATIGGAELRTLVTGALYLVSTAALLRAIRSMVDNPMTSAVIGAAAVSLVAARVEVRGDALGANTRMRILWGAIIALSVTAVGVAVVLATGGSLVMGSTSAAAFFGVIEAVGIGYGSEMLLRGIPLTFARRANVADRHAFTFAAMAGVALVMLEPNAKPMGLVVVAASSAAFTALWMRGGDGHGPIAAHVLWVWLTDAALGGDVVQLTEATGKLTTRQSATGWATMAVAGAFAAVTVLVLTNVIPIHRWMASAEPQPTKRRKSTPRRKKRKTKKLS